MASKTPHLSEFYTSGLENVLCATSNLAGAEGFVVDVYALPGEYDTADGFSYEGYSLEFHVGHPVVQDSSQEMPTPSLPTNLVAHCHSLPWSTRSRVADLVLSRVSSSTFYDPAIPVLFTPLNPVRSVTANHTDDPQLSEEEKELLEEENRDHMRTELQGNCPTFTPIVSTCIFPKVHSTRDSTIDVDVHCTEGEFSYKNGRKEPGWLLESRPPPNKSQSSDNKTTPIAHIYADDGHFFSYGCTAVRDYWIYKNLDPTDLKGSVILCRPPTTSNPDVKPPPKQRQFGRERYGSIAEVLSRIK